MLRTITFIAAFLFLSYNSFSQSQEEYKAAFDNLNPESGIVIDKSFLTEEDISSFNGTEPILISNSKWLELYKSIRNSHIELPDWPSKEELETSSLEYLSNGTFPLALLHITVQSIDTNALINGDLTFENAMFNENGANEKIYNSHQVTCYTIFGEYSEVNPPTFVLPEEFVFTQADLDDLQFQFQQSDNYYGDLSIDINHEFELSFASENPTEIILKVIENGKSYYSSSPFIAYGIIIDPNAGASGNSPVSKFFPPDVKKDFRINGTKGVRAYIWHGCNSNKIMKPLIFCEAFDPGFDSPKGAEINRKFRYGDNGWDTFITGWFDDDKLEIESQTLMDLPKFAHEMHNAGYDIIYIDYKNGVDYIQNNARNVVEVIKYVNSELDKNYIANLTEKSSIQLLGISMGGLISKYALNYMEKNHLEHNVSNWITIDSPHEGANIPVGIQHLLNMFYTKLGQSDDEEIKDGYRAVNSIAARQILIYHFSKPDGGFADERIELLNDPYFKGYPKKPRKIAVSNGSSIAKKIPLSNGLRLSTRKGMFRYEAFAPKPNQKTLVAKALPRLGAVIDIFTSWPWEEKNVYERKHFVRNDLDVVPGGIIPI